MYALGDTVTLLGDLMHQFDYSRLQNNTWDGEILSLIAQIYAYKGKQELYNRMKPVELERLVEIAKIQSTESSNKIENIGTSSARMKQLMAERTAPRNRNEQEILGYRDVLDLIHNNYEYIEISKNVILQLHRDLLQYTPLTYRGQFKNTQNYISEIVSDGSMHIIFTPLEPYKTPQAIDDSCESYKRIIASEAIDPLLLIPIFILDFLCIHPFNDGNGRMSRLLTALLLYKSDFIVGKYISIEKKIETTKLEYYDALARSSSNWKEGKNDYLPFIKYMLGIILSCYRDLEKRIEVSDRASSAYDIVKVVVDDTLGKFTKQQIWELCPSISRASVENALKKLTEEKLIVRLGAGPSTAYIKTKISLK